MHACTTVDSSELGQVCAAEWEPHRHTPCAEQHPAQLGHPISQPQSSPGSPTPALWYADASAVHKTPLPAVASAPLVRIESAQASHAMKTHTTGGGRDGAPTKPHIGTCIHTDTWRYTHVKNRPHVFVHTTRMHAAFIAHRGSTGNAQNACIHSRYTHTHTHMHSHTQMHTRARTHTHIHKHTHMNTHSHV